MDEMDNLIGRPPTAKQSSNSNVDHLASNSEEDDIIDNLYNDDDDDQARSDDPSTIVAAANRDNLADSVTLPPETV